MKKYFIIVSLVLLVTVGCNLKNSDTTVQQEQAHTEANQSKLLKSQPPVSLDYSLERENINNRTTLWNDPNKVSYIYLTDFGKIMAFYTIKGKVSSVNSQITNPQQLVKPTIHYHERYVLPSPAEDGSYGTNGDAVFFFTTDGTYVEWNKGYMLCDKPLKLSTPPVMTIITKE